MSLIERNTVVDGVDLPSDEGTNGGGSESNISTQPAQAGIEQSMLDVIKQLRELNSNILKLNSKIDRLQYPGRKIRHVYGRIRRS